MAKREVSRRDLFDRAWNRPMTILAVELDTKPAALSALARRLGLPLPTSGHWAQKEVGKEPPTPPYPADPALDSVLYPLPAPPKLISPQLGRRPGTASNARPPIGETPRCAATALDENGHPVPAEHACVSKTRIAIGRSRKIGRVSVSGRGRFRLLLCHDSGERACKFLDRLVAAAEDMGWTLENTDEGYAIAAHGEAIGFFIEEKLGEVPHVVTLAETREQAEYERRCALADRGLGHRPWRAPSVPDHDYVPCGELALKFDQDYAAAGIRRTFSDGKRQRLEDLVPSIIEALGRRAGAVKAHRDDMAERKREWAEQERLRGDRERQARVESYRVAFLRRQIERRQEIDGISGLIASWQGAESADPTFAELIEFARHYRARLQEMITPAAIAERIEKLKLMEDDVYIYDVKRID